LCSFLIVPRADTGGEVFGDLFSPRLAPPIPRRPARANVLLRE
jgi:hypothetical protein